MIDREIGVERMIIEVHKGIPIEWDTDKQVYRCVNHIFNTLEEAKGWLFCSYFGYE